MEVVGWGETPHGLKYWVIRNSWGTYWAEGGWFKLRRGTNELLSESSCEWAVPTWDDLELSLGGKTMGDYVHGISKILVDDGSATLRLQVAPCLSDRKLAWLTLQGVGAAQSRCQCVVRILPKSCEMHSAQSCRPRFHPIQR